MSLKYEQSIPVTAEVDVLVAGGGLGGVSAAMSAARAGARVMLVEANGFLGGVATAGMCCSLCNCMFSGSRELKVKGMPLVIVDALAVGAGPGMSWRKHKGHMIYDVEKAKLVLAELLEKENVAVRLNTPVADVRMDGRRVTHLIVSGKNGLEAIACKTLVDATGDCDVLARTGVEMKLTPHTPASYVFRLGNVDADKFVQYLCENPDQFPGKMDVDWSLEEAVAMYRDNGTFLFPHGGGMQMTRIRQAAENGDLPEKLGCYDTLDAMQMHLIRESGVCHVITGFTNNGDMDAEGLTKRILDGKRVAFMFNDMMKKYMPGFENSFVSQTADDLGIRGSRKIVGESTFELRMRDTAYRCRDAVGVGVVEQHLKLEKAANAWSAQVYGEDVWELPLSCLIPKGLDNVVVGAGRGADSEPAQLLRVMVLTMVVGQGAGVAAAVAAKQKLSIKHTDYVVIRRELVRQGVEFPKD